LVLSALIAGSDILIELLYPKSYESAGWMLRILSIGVWISVMASVNSTMLLARGNARMMSFAWGVKLAAKLIALPLGFSFGGLPLAVAGASVSDAANYEFTARSIGRFGPESRKMDLRVSVRVAVAAGLAWWCARAAAHFGCPAVLCAAVVILVCALVWAAPLIQLERAWRAS
jgi:O-antigen/teichoic acid export membrane protein